MSRKRETSGAVKIPAIGGPERILKESAIPASGRRAVGPVFALLPNGKGWITGYPMEGSVRVGTPWWLDARSSRSTVYLSDSSDEEQLGTTILD